MITRPGSGQELIGEPKQIFESSLPHNIVSR
jgi:hypothetical protein